MIAAENDERYATHSFIKIFLFLRQHDHRSSFVMSKLTVPEMSPTLKAMKSCKGRAFYNVIAYKTREDLAKTMEKQRPDLFNFVPVR